MKSSKLDSLRIDNSVRERPRLPLAVILLGIALVAGVSLYFAIPRASDAERIAGKKKPANATSAALPPSATNSTLTPRSATSSPLVKNSVLTVSGYIVNRERIELSPRFMGVVKWIGVKKGDAVTNNQVVVL
ncbi:MAG: efflux RND transporter periplasmic adaptor subunit, partial [Verrucomicrobia bacterium]|nr:efflux RND transporter periplasmic adaptor subunit [Verrucomicrobiota bacterium]